MLDLLHAWGLALVTLGGLLEIFGVGSPVLGGVVAAVGFGLSLVALFLGGRE